MEILELNQARTLCERLNRAPIEELEIETIYPENTLRIRLRVEDASIGLCYFHTVGSKRKCYDDKQGYWVEDVPTLSYLLSFDRDGIFAELVAKCGILSGGRTFSNDADSPVWELLEKNYEKIKQKHIAHCRAKERERLDQAIDSLCIQTEK